MLLKDHLKKVFKKASLENNSLLKENIVIKWVHRFGIDSLNDLLIHSPVISENQHEGEYQEQISLINEEHEEENQEQISLINEEHEEENQEQFNPKLLKNLDNPEVDNHKSKNFETSSYDDISNKNQISDPHSKKYNNMKKLPLPYIKNLRKWINNEKKAS